jgi:hypothetical protein
MAPPAAVAALPAARDTANSAEWLPAFLDLLVLIGFLLHPERGD